jgi:hypothetical protein
MALAKTWPEFDTNGDLPEGLHQATLADVLQYFGRGTVKRHLVAQRLERIYNLAYSTGQVLRFIVFGSFVTAKPEPGDVDIFILMKNSFDSTVVHGEAAIVFDHLLAQNIEGASVFWIRQEAAIGEEEEAVRYWQTNATIRDAG